ncbi:MAG: hypothetical protein ABW136_02940, partial [Steroidobacteraceae bacterium]
MATAVTDESELISLREAIRAASLRDEAASRRDLLSEADSMRDVLEAAPARAAEWVKRARSSRAR